MADAQSPDASPKPSTPPVAAAAGAPGEPPALGAEGVFSLEDLDKIIESEDPNFKTDMAGIKTAGADIKVEIDALSDVEANDAAAVQESETADQEEAEEKSTLKNRIVGALLKPARRVKAYWHLKKLALKNKSLLFFESTKNFFKNDFPKHCKTLLSKIKAGAKATSLFTKTHWKSFASLSVAQKTAFFLAIVFAIAAVAIFSRTFLGGWLPRFIDPLVHSLGDGAQYVRGYKDKSDLQDLFQAFPEVEFYVLLDKVIVNVKPDSQSGRNPMGAFELYLGVDSQDTAIEVKDRQRELLDIIQRAIEGFTYSELISQVGKVRVKSVVRDRVNDVLNQGHVFRVYFNTFITTP